MDDERIERAAQRAATILVAEDLDALRAKYERELFEFRIANGYGPVNSSTPGIAAIRGKYRALGLNI